MTIADTIKTEKFEVHNRRTNAIQFTAEITCAPDATYSVKLGLAVEWAVNARANLARANLSGAYLAGAKIGGDTIARVIAIAHRLDGYAFTAFKLDTGAVKIKAGCRYFTPAEFREHVAQSYPDTPKAVETLSIIEHIERMAALFAEDEG